MPDRSAKTNHPSVPNIVGKSILARYLVALLSVTIAFVIRWLLEPLLGNDFVFLTLYGAVAVSVWYGGWRPAILSALLGFLITNYFFLAPRYQLVFSTAVWAGVIGYALSCGIIIYLGETMRRANDRTQQQKNILATTLSSIGDAVIATNARGLLLSCYQTI